MTDDFHVLPTPKLKQAARNCPLLEGDPEAWIVCCSQRFFPIAKRIAGDDGLAEDALQESWIKILQGIRHACFDGPKACPWVHAIIVNTARNIRSQSVRRGEVSLREREDPARGPEFLVREREMLVLLGEIIQLLPDTYRQVIELRLYRGLSNQQIAHTLHISRRNAATRLTRAVALLKRRLGSRIRSLSTPLRRK